MHHDTAVLAGDAGGESLTAGNLLVLSPHMDDALLSIASIALTRPCEVWTVFAGRPERPMSTTWDDSCGFADSDETITARVQEDDQAFSGIPATNHRLDYLEGAYSTPERRVQDLADFERRLRAWAAEHQSGTVLIPAGAGVTMPPAWYETPLRKLRKVTDRGRTSPSSRATEAAATTDESTATSVGVPRTSPALPVAVVGMVKHRLRTTAQHAAHAAYLRRRRKATREGMGSNPDHLAVRDAAVRILADAPHITVVAYEELPYLWHRSADKAIGEFTRQHGLTARPWARPVDREAKARQIAAYRSQLPVIDSVGRLQQAETLPDTERFWTLSRQA